VVCMEEEVEGGVYERKMLSGVASFTVGTSSGETTRQLVQSFQRVDNPMQQGNVACVRLCDDRF